VNTVLARCAFRALVLLWLAAGSGVRPAAAQEALTELLSAQMHPLSVEQGALSGDGAAVLLEAAANAQFFLIAEEHNVGELNAIAQALFADAPAEARVLIGALMRTTRIYYAWAEGRRGRPTGYFSSADRELSMKRRFMERYQAARATGDPRPRVLVKAGHWHAFRGIYRAAVPTFGNFLSEFAISNGMESFVLSTYVTDSQEDWRNTSGPLASVVPEGVTAVVDFRPLRGLARQNAIDGLDDAFKATLFRADAALVISGGRTGASTVADSAR
jgi:hypothetical protein